MRILRITLITIASFFLLILLWAFLFGPEQYYIFNPMIDTEVSSEFSKEKFDRIRVGMDSSEVKSIIGEPLYKQYDRADNCILFQYTNDGKLMNQEIAWYLSGDYAWFAADVYFDSLGKVSKEHGRWVYD